MKFLSTANASVMAVIDGPVASLPESRFANKMGEWIMKVSVE